MSEIAMARLNVRLEANIARFEEKMNKAVRSSYAASAKIQKGFNQVNAANLGRGLDNIFGSARLAAMDAGASRLGVFGGALGELGGIGLAAAAAVGAFAVALNQARGAMTFADELSDSAVQAQVSVEALQEYRLAMVAVGGSEKDADEALKGFSASLGKAQAGLPKALKWFKALGFTQEQLQSFTSADQLLPQIADKIAALGSEAQKAAITEALGLRPMLPLLQQGAAGIEALTAKMRDLGVVMDAETVEAMAKAHDEAELLSKIIDLQLKQAFVALAPVIVGALQVAADWARGVREFTDDVGEATKGVGDLLSIAGAIAGLKIGLTFDDTSLRQMEARVRALFRLLANFDPSARAVSGAMEARARRSGEGFAPAIVGGLGGALAPRPTGPIVDLGSNSGSSGSRSRGRSGADEAARERERLAKEALQQERSFNDQLARIEGEMLRAALASAETADERYELGRERARADRAALEESLARQVTDKSLTQAQADELLAQNRTVEIAEARNALRERDMEIMQELIAAAETELAARRAASPLYTYATDTQDPSRSREESIVSAFDALDNGIAQILTSANGAQDALHKLGDLALQVFQQMAADFLKAMIRQNVTAPAANWLSTAFKVVGAVTGGGAGGRAMGGPVRAGRSYTVGERGPEHFVPSENGVIMSNAQLNAGPAPQGGGTMRVMVVPSDYFKVVVREVAAPLASSAAAMAVKASSSLIPREQRRRSGQRLGMAR